MIRKLRRQFVAFSMVIVLLVVSTAMSAVYITTARNVEAETASMMRELITEPIRMPRRPGEEPEKLRLPYFTLVEEADGKITVRGDSNSFDLSDEDFLSLLVTGAEEIAELIPWQKEGKNAGTELAEGTAEKTEAESIGMKGLKTGFLKEYNLRFLISDGPNGGRALIFADVSSEYKALNGLKNSCIRGGIAAMAIFFLISVALSRTVTKPVEQAWRQQKQFVADASHELKTPLTVILTNAELLQMDDFTPEQKARLSSAIHSMATQMRGLVESLLNLTRADSDQEKIHTRVSFTKIVEDSVMNFEPVFYEKGLMLTCDTAKDVFVCGDEAQLRELTDILLDNAQKYSFPDGTTKVTLSVQHSFCCLRVTNPGEEISAEDLKNIFKRFYRVDKARTMNQSYGLGLSIAETVVKNHDGKIWAKSENGINSFCVQLPVI